MDSPTTNPADDDGLATSGNHQNPTGSGNIPAADLGAGAGGGSGSSKKKWNSKKDKIPSLLNSSQLQQQQNNSQNDQKRRNHSNFNQVLSQNQHRQGQGQQQSTNKGHQGQQQSNKGHQGQGSSSGNWRHNRRTPKSNNTTATTPIKNKNQGLIFPSTSNNSIPLPSLLPGKPGKQDQQQDSSKLPSLLDIFGVKGEALKNSSNHGHGHDRHQNHYNFNFDAKEFYPSNYNNLYSNQQHQQYQYEGQEGAEAMYYDNYCPTEADGYYYEEATYMEKNAYYDYNDNSSYSHGSYNNKGSKNNYKKSSTNDYEKKKSKGPRNEKLNQRETLEEDLRNGQLSCLVCFEKIISTNNNRKKSNFNDDLIPIWHCSQSCFNIFHLKCIREWALKSTASSNSSNMTGENEYERESNILGIGISLPLSFSTNSTRNNNQSNQQSLITITNWRCPSCQIIYTQIPSESDYKCFCGKVKNPGPPSHSCGQTCQKLRPPMYFDQNQEEKVLCVHPCELQCHPGQCNPCQAFIQRKCPCLKSSAIVLCSNPFFKCDNQCSKFLNGCILKDNDQKDIHNSQEHICKKTCHFLNCDKCSISTPLECYCGKEKDVRTELCSDLTKLLASDPPEITTVVDVDEEITKYFYSCLKECGKLLDCKVHYCAELCHQSKCKPCKTSPELLIYCPCGKSTIEKILGKKRKLCTEPFPTTCGQLCNKVMADCGTNALSSTSDSKNNVHLCQEICHNNLEPHKCDRTTFVICRCKNLTSEMSCMELKDKNEIKCKKKCNKKRKCGKHKCIELCCNLSITDQEHICTYICERMLTCGQHQCLRLCHGFNKCPECQIASYTELTCECGSSVILPPVPCGTPIPICNKLCSRSHQDLEICGHDVMHNCHSNPECPPCNMLTKKWCFGDHEERKNIPCHVKSFSCGTPCKKILPCTRHECPRMCHDKSCWKEDEEGSGYVCKLPCEIPRKLSCGHPCALQCHDGICPDSNCKLLVECTCLCSRRKERLICFRREAEYQRLVDIAVKKQMQIQAEQSKEKVNDPQEDNKDKEKDEKCEKKIRILKDEIILWKMNNRFAILPCDKECQRLIRLRKLAEALQINDDSITQDRPSQTSADIKESQRTINDSDLTSSSDYIRFGDPNYSDFLKSMAKKHPSYVEMVFEKLKFIVLESQSKEFEEKNPNKNYISFSFPSANRDKRHIIHEMAEHFGVKSEAFDEEPNRNVVVAAFKDKCWLPTKSLIEVVFPKK